MIGRTGPGAGRKAVRGRAVVDQGAVQVEKHTAQPHGGHPMLGTVDVTPIPLGTWPTPLEPAPRLAAALGLDELWIKRDDLTGLGGGGNKVRKLQYTCAEAVQAGATRLVTTGAPQSNHARLTAAAAARL